MAKEKTIEIEISHYDMETPELIAEFKRLGLQTFNSLAFQFSRPKSGIHHVKTDRVFSNQYDTTEGVRIFEKCSRLDYPSLRPTFGYYISKGIEKIHEYQNDLKICRYCGAQYYKSNIQWCNKCRGSQYLEPKNYYLLKLTNIREKYAPSDTPIPDNILNDIKAQQKQSANTRLETALKNRLSRLKKEKIGIIKETAFLKKLISAGFTDLENVIYYDHTDTFCFGWRAALTEKEKNEILSMVENWGYNIQFK